MTLACMGMTPGFSSEYRDIKSYTSQNINVNKRAQDKSDHNVIEPAAGVEEILADKEVDELIIINDPSDVEQTTTVETVTEDILLANPDETVEVPDDISDMMSEIAVEAGKNEQDNQLYSLGPDDKIKITVFGEQDLTGEFVINGDGAITFPLLGYVAVEGLDVAKLGQMLETRLRGDYLKDPNVSVEIIQNRPFYILGEVREPGSYDFVNGMNILQAVAIGGGYTYRANRKTIDVMRKKQGDSTLTKMSSDASVQPGDIIYVRERFF